MKFCDNWPSGFEDMFEIIILLVSLVKGQTMTLTSCSYKSCTH